jgi:chaperone required for assembly of F1-ATPase
MSTAKLALLAVATSLCAAFVTEVALAQGKTREQVRQELAQARHDGMLPISKTSYPPTADQMARNRELHAIARHPGEANPAIDHHDGTFASR